MSVMHGNLVNPRAWITDRRADLCAVSLRARNHYAVRHAVGGARKTHKDTDNFRWSAV
jgi:hypothetical protein